MIRAGLIILWLIGLAGCLSVPAPMMPLPSNTVVPPSQTSTATIVWFPPTATFTPLPTMTLSITPTLDLRPNYGSLILQDDFSQSENWTIGEMSAGNVALGKNELSLGVSSPPGYLYSMRRDTTLDDFYLEINASPSICRGKDEYGLLFRVSPSSDFFRFGLNCAGEARLRPLSIRASLFTEATRAERGCSTRRAQLIPAGCLGGRARSPFLCQRDFPV